MTNVLFDRVEGKSIHLMKKVNKNIKQLMLFRLFDVLGNYMYCSKSLEVLTEKTASLSKN